ncbi:antibiotic biosynthesis monooxygenase [Ferrovibrio terrae]|uniref:putative quinol monooxygenase n=1 Tax=Ferrovibrio terrae TaxID=2594003 RepID=UPI003137DB4A
MIVRVWISGYDATRLDDFIDFARDRLEPFFRDQDGCLGCMFNYDAEQWRTVSYWRDMAAIDAVKTSPVYHEILEDLVASGMLAGSQSVRTMNVAGGRLYAPLPL